MDTVESGIVDQNLRQISELDLSSRDPIDGFNLDDTDASIWVKGVAVEIFCMTTVFRIRVAENSCLTYLNFRLI